MFMMKRTPALVLMVVCGMLLSDIKLAECLKCYSCSGCNGKDTEEQCTSGVGGREPTCFKSVFKDVVTKGCGLALNQTVKCDDLGSGNKWCYCDTDLCNNAPIMVAGYSKRLLLFSALTSSVATYHLIFL